MRRGFTLIELLVVITIIALLIGLLFPVIKGVRSSANVAATRSRISGIVNAIERYQQDFQSYPTVFSEDSIRLAQAKTWQALPLTDTTVAPDPINPAGYTNLTMTESMVLALVGGLEVRTPPAVPAFNYVPSRATGGQGTVALGVQRKQYSAYTQLPLTEKGASGLPGATDSNVPEFLDAMPEPMPILYMRARTGAAGIEGNTTAFQYNREFLAPYVGATFPPATSGITAAQYFGNPTQPGTARNKDGFILIAAGKDRKYGTKDDLTNAGDVVP